MHRISKNAIVPYSVEQMFALINKINDYPQFLNWCSSSCILNQSEEQITASIEINKAGLKQKFTTKNTLHAFELIEIELLDGPFNELSGQWRFKSLGEKASKINLELQFSFKSKLMDISLSPVFAKIGNSQLDAFVARAKELYG